MLKTFSLSFSGCLPGYCSDPVLCPLCLRLLLPQPEYWDQPGRGCGLGRGGWRVDNVLDSTLHAHYARGREGDKECVPEVPYLVWACTFGDTVKCLFRGNDTMHQTCQVSGHFFKFALFYIETFLFPFIFCMAAHSEIVIIIIQSLIILQCYFLLSSRGQIWECSFDCCSRKKPATPCKTFCGKKKRKKNLHSAKQMSLFLHKSSKRQSRPSPVNHILQSHVPLLAPLIEKCKSPAEPLVTSRQTLASHSSAQTSPAGYLEITKCEIRIHKALVLIEHVCGIQSDTLYLPHIHAARRQTPTALASQIWSCAFIWMEITETNDDWMEVSLYVFS